MPGKEKRRWPVLVFIAFLAGSGVIAALVILAPRPSSGPARAVADDGPRLVRQSLFEDAKDSRELEARLAGRDRNGEERESALNMVPRFDKPGEDAARAGSSASGREASGKGARRAKKKDLPTGYSRELTEEEKRALERAAGGWDKDKAYLTGAKKGLLFAVGKALFRHPKVLKYLLDNELVIKGFMSQKRVRQNCGSGQSLSNYLSDTRDPSGVGLSRSIFMESTRYPGATTAIMGSQLAHTVLSDCSGVRTFTRSKDLITQTAMANPQIMMDFANPAIVQAMAASPLTSRLMQDVNASKTVAP